MMRILFWIIIMTIFSIVEASFFRSLPGWFTVTPLILGICVYFVQHQGIQECAWWLPVHGIFLDYLSLGTTMLESLPYMVSALFLLFSARHLFSNRSFYGLLSCGISGFVGLVVTQIFLNMFRIFSGNAIQWHVFAEEVMIRLCLLLLVISIMYPFAKYIRLFLLTFSLFPDTRKP